MTRLTDQEQDQMWESVIILSQIDIEKSKTVLKATIEKALRQLNIVSPILSTIRFSAPNVDQLSALRHIEKKMREAYEHKEVEKAYEYLVEYIEQLSDLIEKDSITTKKKLYASILAQNSGKPHKLQISPSQLHTAKIVATEEDKSFYKSSEVAEKLGLSDQTIRRMCDQEKFPGAYRTPGGHWRIPQDAFITTREQGERAEEVLHQIDIKNKDAGDVDEFDL